MIVTKLNSAWLQQNMEMIRKLMVSFNLKKGQHFILDHWNGLIPVDKKTLESDFEEKCHWNCWYCLSLLRWIGVLILCILLKLRHWNLEPWFVLWTFHRLKLGDMFIGLLYCCHVWVVAFNCKLNMFDKLQKHACMVAAAV